MRRLRRGEVAIELGDDQRDVASVEVLGDVDSVAFVIEQVGRGDRIRANLTLTFFGPSFLGLTLAKTPRGSESNITGSEAANATPVALWPFRSLNPWT